MWWLYEGATFLVVLADTSSAGTPPLATDDITSWTSYFVGEEYDLFLTGGTAEYDASLAQRATLERLVITLNYPTSITYTDVLIVALPLIDPGESAPIYAFPFVGVIQESSPVTLLSTETKTYNLDLYAEAI